MDVKSLKLNIYPTSIILENNDKAQVGRLFYSYGENDVVCIDRLYVVPNYRKQGLGTYLINTLIENNINSSMLVNAFSDDEEYMPTKKLIEFYNKFGFLYHQETEEGFLLKRK